MASLDSISSSATASTSAPNASSYQREPSAPQGGSGGGGRGDNSHPHQHRFTKFTGASRRGSFVVVDAIRRAFSMEPYSPVPVTDDVESSAGHQGGGDNHQHHHHHGGHHASSRKFFMLASILVPFVFFTIWVGKENASARRNPIAPIKPYGPTSESDAACTSPSVADPMYKLKSSSTLSGLTQAAVAADHPVCSQIGLEILEMDGNAVDAAVAVALCLGVANPASSGMGGGAFLLVHANPVTPEKESKMPIFNDARDPEYVASAESGKVTEVIDCREVAPAAASTDMYEGLPDLASVRGGLSIGVPGELRGLELAHARHGKLPWSSVVGPVHQLAVKGVTVNQNFAHEIQIMYRRYHRNNEFPELRKLLTKNDDWKSTLIQGDVLRNPALANLLGEIREHGSDALYSGKRAEIFAKDIQEAGGIVTKEDIENYRPTLRSPVYAHNIEGYSIVGVPPPSSGGAAIIGAARFLSGFSDPLVARADTLSAHRMVEAEKHSFAIRMSLSDPSFDTETVKAAVEDLTRGTYMEELRQQSSDSDILPMSKYGGEKWAQLNDGDGTQHAEDADEGDRRRRLNGRRFGNLEDNGTSHFSIVDKDGNAVAMTTSVNTYFGSNVVSPSTGIILSNTMDDFSNPGRPNYFGLNPSESNYITPGKKPLSSMSPTMIFQTAADGDKLGDLSLVIGASGGPKIISAVLQVFANHLLFGMSLFDAVVYPRFHDQLIYHGSAVCTAENTVLEQGPSISLSNRTRQALQRRGHELLDVTYEGTVQAISLDTETREMTAVCDVRKGGTPAGA